MRRSLSPSVAANRLQRSLHVALVSFAWLTLWLFPSLARGQLLVSFDGTPGSVNSYNPTTGAVTQSPFATINRPFSMVSDGTDVYITSYNASTGSIGKYTLGGAVVNAALVTGLSGPYGIAVTGGDIYEVNQADQTIKSFSTATGVANPLFTNIDIAGASPSGIAVLGSNLYIVEQANDQVSEWDLNGTLINRTFINSGGTTIAGFGNDLYLTTGDGVAEYNATTGAAINADFITGLTSPFGVSLTPDGSILYVTDASVGTVGEYNAITGAAINASLITGLTSPLGIYAGLVGPTLGIYWDIPVGGPSGTWDTTSAFWSPSSGGGSPIAWVNGSDAVFSADDLAATGSFTVTLGENLSVGNLTYRGGTAGSILDIAVGVGNTITMANPTMNVTVDPGTTLVIAPVIAGAGNLVLESGTLVLTGANTYTGGTTITAGTLQIGNGGVTGSILGDVVDNGTLAFNHSDAIVFSGAVSGTGVLSQIGTGSVTLTGLNTYTGGTTIKAGTLSVANDSFLGGPGGGITLQGGELLTTGLNFVSARLVTLNTAGTANILAAATGTIANYSGVISGAGSLQVGDGNNHLGMVVLSNISNTYLGGTTVTGGASLSVDNDSELGGVGGGITLQGGKLVMNTASFSTARTITLGPQVNTLAAPNPIDFRNATFTGLITGSGALTVGDAHSSSLTVTLGNSANDYSGGTTITGGATVEINTPTDGELGTGALTLNGGALSTTLDGFVSGRAITLMPNAFANILIAGSFDTATYSGVISGTGGLLIGGGTVVLGAVNTYSGGTTVTNGTVVVSDNTNFGASNTGITLFGGEIVSTVEGFFSPRPILLVDEGDFPNVLAAGDGTTGSYGGVISGDSTLQIGNGDGPEATGIVRLSGVNTYTGGTVVTAGATLSIGADSALGLAGTAITLRRGELLTTGTFSTTRPINLEQDSTFTNILAAAANTTMTYQGIISGNGPLQIGDGGTSGTIVFLANNTYVGATTVVTHAVLSVDKDAELGNPANGIKLRFGGELLTTTDFTTARTVNLNPPIVGPGGIVTPLGPVSLNILAAAPNTAVTYTGLVFGTGGLEIGDLKGNSGTVILTDVANSYTGGTIIEGGATLSVASDPILGDSSGGLTLQSGEFLTTGNAFTSARAITLGAGADILAAANGTTANYTGVLSNGGTPGILFIGDPAHPGTVILSGRNTYTGGTILQAGTLLVNNAQALGTGDVAVNGGVLAADPQPINVGGNYTQSAAGTLQLGIAGRAAGQFDTLNVGGNAGLNGALALVNLGFHPQAGDKLQLITTGGLVTSRFATFQNPFTLAIGFNTVDLVYARQSVTLVFLNLTTPVTPGTPPGAPEVIETTDFSSFAFTPNQSAAASLLDAVQLDPKAANLISFLNTEPFANLPADFHKISPEGLTAFYEISFSNANIQKLTLEGRLDDLHSGSNGFSSNMKVNGATINDTPNPDGKSSKAVLEPVLQHTPENRWGVWVTGFGDFVNVDGDGNAKGYNFTTGGVSLGLDFRLTDQLAIGVMGDYSHTWTSLNPGHLDVDSGRGGIYASWFNRGFYVNGAIYGGHNNYDSNRSGLGGAANGSTEGSEWSTFIGAGYDYHLGSLTVGPVASLQYTDVGIDQFNEKGSIAPLDVHSGSAESLRSDVGFRIFYQWQFGKIVIEPSLKAAWEHEYKYSALPITAGFAGVPGPSATFFGPSEGHDSALISAGVSVQLTSSIATYVNYDGQLGRGNYDSNAVTGGFRINF